MTEADSAEARRAAARDAFFNGGASVVYLGPMVDWREVVMTTPDEDGDPDDLPNPSRD